MIYVKITNFIISCINGKPIIDTQAFANDFTTK